jgi:hypothetical protein
MEPYDRVNRYKRILDRHFKQQGLEVHLDVSISDEIRWRPHLFVRNDVKIIVDVVDTQVIPSLQLRKYVDVMNVYPDMKVYIAMVGEMPYAPNLIMDCARYGVGVYVVQPRRLTELLQPQPRRIERIAATDQLAIVPGAPFGNVLSLRKCFRNCRDHLYWLENNLPKGVLEVIYDNVREGDLSGIESVKLLRGVDDKIGSSFHDEFKDFHSEMVSNYDVDSEMRVILDRKVTGTVHGRYLYSADQNGKEKVLQLPPLNSLKGNQWDTIFTDVKSVPPFDELWKQGTDILQRWDSVQEAVRLHLKSKEKEASLRGR